MTSPESGLCGICFGPIDAKDAPRGKINSCDHVFCHECIGEWAARTNTCPHCKQRFTRIHTQQPDGKVAEKKIRKRNYRFDEDDMSDDSDDDEDGEDGGGWEAGARSLLLGAPATPQPGRTLICSACDGFDEPHTMLLCNVRTCSRSIHARCIVDGPTVTADGLVDDAAVWTCRDCGGTADQHPVAAEPVSGACPRAQVAAVPVRPSAAVAPDDTASAADSDSMPPPLPTVEPAPRMPPVRRVPPPADSRPRPAPSPSAERPILHMTEPASRRSRIRPTPSPSPSPVAPSWSRGTSAVALDVMAPNTEPMRAFLGEYRPELMAAQQQSGLAELARRQQARAQLSKQKAAQRGQRDAAMGVSTYHHKADERRPGQPGASARRDAFPLRTVKSLEEVEAEAYARRYEELRDAARRDHENEIRMGSSARRFGAQAAADMAASQQRLAYRLTNAATQARQYAASYVVDVAAEREQYAQRERARQAIQQAAALRKLQLLIASKRVAETGRGNAQPPAFPVKTEPGELPPPATSPMAPATVPKKQPVIRRPPPPPPPAAST